MSSLDVKKQGPEKIQDIVKCGNSAFVLNLKDLVVVLRRFWLNKQSVVLISSILGLVSVGVVGAIIAQFLGVFSIPLEGINALILLELILFAIGIGIGVFAFWKLAFVKPARYMINVVYQKRCHLGEPVYNILDFLAEDSLEFLHLLYTKKYSKIPHKFDCVKDVISRVALEQFDLAELVEYYKQKQSLVVASSKGLEIALLKETVLWAVYYSIQFGAVYITPDILFVALIRALDAKELLSGRFHASLEDMEKVAHWHANNLRVRFLHKRLNIFAPYIRKQGIVDSWFVGFTYYISKMSTDIVEQLRYNPGVYNLAHPGLDQKLMEVLLKPVTPNALLVGEPGTGKTSIIYGLAQRIVEADVPQALLHKKIYSIDLNKMLSFVREAGGVGQFMQYLENELKQDPEVIFFVDDIALLFEGETNRQLLLQLLTLLAKYNIPVVATMTFTEYTKFKVDYSTLAVNFEVIEVPEASEEATYTILTTKIEPAERKYHVKILFPALSEVIYLTKVYMPADKFPKKAIVIFDKAVALASAAHSKFLTAEFVKKAVEDTVKIKIGANDKETINKLMHLEEHIHARYINQEFAVHELVEALKRSRLQLSNPNKPIGVFLFLGPTGVGKTYLAKIAAEEFFGTRHRIIRVDLSQYKMPSDIYQVLNILSQVRLSPYSLILLDEFEKAHPDIHDMFLRMFDEGVIRDQNGEDLYFTNSLIVATSNIGSREILQAGTDYKKAKQIITSLLPTYLKPELINRFDSIIIFRALTKEELIKVADLLMKQLRFELDKKHMRLLWDDTVLKVIVEKSYDPMMGARPIKRFIEDKIKTLIANYILAYRSKYGKNPEVIDLRPHPKSENVDNKNNNSTSTHNKTSAQNLNGNNKENNLQASSNNSANRNTATGINTSETGENSVSKNTPAGTNNSITGDNQTSKQTSNKATSAGQTTPQTVNTNQTSGLSNDQTNEQTGKLSNGLGDGQSSGQSSNGLGHEQAREQAINTNQINSQSANPNQTNNAISTSNPSQPNNTNQ